MDPRYRRWNRRGASVDDLNRRKSVAERSSRGRGRIFTHPVPEAMYLVSKLACFFFGIVVPTFASILTIDSKSKEDDTQWLMYWVVYAVYMSVEKILSKAIVYLPIYEEMKLSGILWLILPQTKGATLIYQSAIQPAFRHVIQMPVVQNYLKRLDHPLAKKLSGRKSASSSK